MILRAALKRQWLDVDDRKEIVGMVTQKIIQSGKVLNILN